MLLHLRNFGPVSNFLCEWVYDFIIGGSNEVYKKLTDKVLGCKNKFREISEKVYKHFVFIRIYTKERRKTTLIQL